jgi:PAT family acetyl-CoA transporter-like MFS transporter 1
MVTLGGFIFFWGCVFVSTTLLVALKTEDRARDDVPNTCYSVWETYKQLYKILTLGPVRSMCLVLLSVKIGFAVTDAATNLKLIEYGMPKEEIALMSPLLIITGIAVPVMLTKATSGPRPLSVFLRAYTPRIVVGLLYGGLLPLARQAYIVGKNTTHTPFRLVFLTTVGLREVAANAMFVAQMAFFARVSDPSIGGTYMTLLNTVSNLGSSWVRTVSLVLLDMLTVRECRLKVSDLDLGTNLDTQTQTLGSEAQNLSSSSSLGLPVVLADGLTCGMEGGKAACEAAGGVCSVSVDGYYVQLVGCTVLGLLWLFVFRPVLLRLENLSPSAWCIGSVGGGKERRGPPTGSGWEEGEGGGGGGGEVEGKYSRLDQYPSARRRRSADDEEKVLGGSSKVL